MYVSCCSIVDTFVLIYTILLPWPLSDGDARTAWIPSAAARVRTADAGDGSARNGDAPNGDGAACAACAACAAGAAAAGDDGWDGVYDGAGAEHGDGDGEEHG